MVNNYHDGYDYVTWWMIDLSKLNACAGTVDQFNDTGHIRYTVEHRFSIYCKMIFSNNDYTDYNI